MSIELINKYNFIYNRLSNRELEGGRFYGFISLDEKCQLILSELCDSDLSTGVYDVYQYGENIGDVVIGEIEDRHRASGIEIRVDLVGHCVCSKYAICKNWSELLAYEGAIESPVEIVFFTDEGITLSKESGNQIFESYQSVSKLYALIKELAGATTGGSATIFYGRPLSFDFTLSEQDLEKPIDVEAITTLLSKDLHKEAIANLICSDLVSFLKDIDAKSRFSYLVRNLTTFVSNVLLSYQGYVENYTFEKVRKEYVEKKTEYIKKIYGVFDDIAIKLLSIPAGIWFATNEISEASYGEVGLYKNTIVIVTVFSLVLILVLHTLGQFSVLKALRNEYTELFNDLARKFDGEAERIENVRGELNSAEFKVEMKLYAAILSAIVMFIMAALLFFISFK